MKRRLRCGRDVPKRWRAIIVIKQGDPGIANSDGKVISKAMPRKIVALACFPKKALNIVSNDLICIVNSASDAIAEID